jgi:hypothetical protein
VIIENGQREHGVRETTPMSARRHQLSLAESMMFSAASALFVDGAFGHDLFRRETEAMRTWRAIGTYNRFFEDNRTIYEDTRSDATIAVVLDDRSRGVTLLNSLAARNVVFDVVYEHDISREILRRYRALLVATDNIRDRGKPAIAEFQARGGTIITADLTMAPSEVARRLNAVAGPAPIRVDAPPGLLYNWVRQDSPERVLVHLLNYNSRPIANIRVAVQGEFQTRRLLSPDSGQQEIRAVPGGVEIPAVDVYSVLVLERRSLR